MRLADLAQPFGVAAAVVDGMDVAAVHAKAAELGALSRTGAGPALLPLMVSLLAGFMAWSRSGISKRYWRELCLSSPQS